MKAVKKLIASTITILGTIAFAQTRVNLKTQSQVVDFSTASATRPMKTGVTLPATCAEGEMFFKSDAPAGANLYGCVAANSWMAQRSQSDLPPVAGFTDTVLTNDGVSARWILLGGDLGGAPGVTKVQGIQQRPVASTAPLDQQALVWNSTDGRWEPRTLASAQGSPAWENDGSPVGTRTVVNVLPGFGLTTALSDTGSKITIQQIVDTGVIQTKADYQSGNARLCATNTGSATTFGCSLSPVLVAYTTPLVLYWRPDTAASGGPTTLNIDSLGPKPVKLSDGISDPAAGDVEAGTLYPIWYDGISFRLLVPSTALRLPSGAQPACEQASRGRMWLTLGDAGVQDEVVVCAKDGNDSYAWRVMY